jgi:hypothetical protein
MKLFYLLLMMPFTLCSCCRLPPDVSKKVDQALEILDEAIANLEKANTDWELILQETRDQLISKGIPEVGNQVKQIIDRTTNNTLVAQFCSIDFIGTRLIQELNNIKAQLLNQPVNTQLVPVICLITTDRGGEGIILNDYPNFIRLTGYDMGTNIKVVVEDSTGNFDITEYYNAGSYQATVTLGANGPALTDTSRRIAFYWTKDQSIELNEFGITRGKPAECQIKQDFPPYTPVVPREITFNPPLIRGDAEFSGNGPTILAQVQLVNLGDRVIAWVSMNARETETWGTTGDGALAYTIFTPPGGYQVLALNVDPRTTFEYMDNNHEEDPREGNGGNFIAEAFFIGDTDDDDVCPTVNCGWDPPHTGVRIKFNKLNFSLIQTDDCTPLVNKSPDEIDEKYESLRGKYGSPLGPELHTADGTGRLRQYERGWIYWTPNTGAHLIYGSIYEKWASLGYEASVLGYPITDETPTADGRGRFNQFQYGFIYWTPETGAHAVYGAIYDKWVSLGAESGSLGYPVSDEHWGDNWIGGSSGNWSRISEFEHGWIECKWGDGLEVIDK